MEKISSAAPSRPRERGRPKGSGAAPSDAVRAVRKKLGSQQKLAEELRCSLSAVRAMEREHRLPGSGALLEKFTEIAGRVGVPLDYQEPEEEAA